MVIQIDKVTKKIGKITILNQVSLKLAKNQIISFIGPNGAGKSTLLGVMSRLLPIDEGQVLIEGINIHTAPSEDVARKLAILKQSNDISLRLTVQDLVSFGRFPYTKGKLTPTDLELINKAIAYMELEAIRFKYIDELSGGQKQRAYIAMVLAQNTDYVFLDEPLNNLDMKHSVQIMQVLRDLVNNHQKTVIIVLHDINFAAAYSDYIVALKDGKLAVEGTVNEVINTNTLQQLYDIHIPIHEIDGQIVATYFK